MKQNQAFVIFALLFLVGCGGPRFVLVEESGGKQLGPFSYRTGTRIRLGDRTYQLKRVVGRDQETKDILKSVTMADFCCLHTQLDDALLQCRRALAKHTDTAGSDGRLIGIGLVAAESFHAEPPLITLHSMDGISVYDALRAIAEIAGLKMTIEGGNVWLRQRDLKQTSPTRNQIGAVKDKTAERSPVGD